MHTYTATTIQKLTREGKLVTRSIIRRDPAGTPLPWMPTRELIRSCRNKYMPHVGAKQLAKLS